MHPTACRRLACIAVSLVCLTGTSCSDSGQTDGDQTADSRDTNSPDGSSGTDGGDSNVDDTAPSDGYERSDSDGSERPDTIDAPAETVVVPGARRAQRETASAVDSTGTRFVAFFDKTHEEIRLARKPPDGSWSESPVDDVDLGDPRNAGSIELEVALVVDDDRLHLAYFSSKEGLKYARRDGSSWQTELLFSSNNRRGGDGLLRLRVDSNGTPYLVHANSETTGVWKRDSRDDWTSVTLPESLREDGDVVDFELGPQDTPFLLIEEQGSSGNNDDLRMASKQSTGWDEVLVDTAASIRWREGDLRFDEAGKPEVAYPKDRDTLDIATRNNGDWIRQSVDLPETLREFHSFYRNSEGEGRALYRDKRTTDSGHQISSMYWARETASGWETEPVPPEDHHTQDASAVYSPPSGPAISFVDKRYRNVNWARRDDSGSWSSEPIEHEKVRVSELVGLGLDGRDRPVVVHELRHIGHVGMARWDGRNWTHAGVKTAPVDASAGPLFDDQDRIIFVSAGKSDDKLTAVRWDGGDWTRSTVDTSIESTAFGGSMLAADASGSPHLLYRSSRTSTDAPIHVRRTDSSWQTEQLDPLQNVSMRTATLSFEVDRQDALHVVGIKSSEDVVYNVDRGDGWTDEMISQTDERALGSPALALESNERPHVLYKFFRDGNYSISHSARRDAGWDSTAIPLELIPGKIEVSSGTGGYLYAAASKLDILKLAEYSRGEWTEIQWTYEGSEVRTHTWDIALSERNERYVAFSNFRTENLVVTRVSDE